MLTQPEPGLQLRTEPDAAPRTETRVLAVLLWARPEAAAGLSWNLLAGSRCAVRPALARASAVHTARA